MKPLTFDLTSLAPAKPAPMSEPPAVAKPAPEPAPLPVTEPRRSPQTETKRPEPRETPRATVAERLARHPGIPAKSAFPQCFGGANGWAADIALEQLQALTTHLLSRAVEEDFRTIAFTSALAGEGKTTITLGIAELLARAGKRVLLVDLDTHRLSLSRRLNLQNAKGALDTLASNGSPARPSYTYETDCAGIHIMPVGTGGGIVQTILQRRPLEELLESCRRDFDIVLLDCPPLVPVADTHVIRDVVDRAILVIRAGSTPAQLVDQALADFGREKVIGAVLNRARPSSIPYFNEIYGYYRHGSNRGRS